MRAHGNKKNNINITSVIHVVENMSLMQNMLMLMRLVDQQWKIICKKRFVVNQHFITKKHYNFIYIKFSLFIHLFILCFFLKNSCSFFIFDWFLWILFSLWAAPLYYFWPTRAIKNTTVSRMFKCTRHYHLYYNLLYILDMFWIHIHLCVMKYYL